MTRNKFITVVTAIAVVAMLMFTVGCGGQKSKSNSSAAKVSEKNIVSSTVPTEDKPPSSANSSGKDEDGEIYSPEDGLDDDDGEPTTSSPTLSVPANSTTPSGTEPSGDSGETDDIFSSKPTGFAGGVY